MTEFEREDPPLGWSDRYLLGFDQMDEIHAEFVSIVAQLQTAPDNDLFSLLDRFAHHAEAHFEQEKMWMESTEFPPRECHIEQHEAVLKSVHEVQQLVAAGNFAICRALARELAAWFPKHTDHMDSALAQWMCKKRHGGVPVVFRRQATAHT